MGSYLKTARKFVGELDAMASKAAIPPQLLVADPYAERFNTLIDRMRANPMPPACLQWLAAHHSALHRTLTVALPDRLDDIWTERKHIGAFVFILDRIWDAHRTGRELYAKRIETTLDLFRKPTGRADGK